MSTPTHLIQVQSGNTRIAYEPVGAWVDVLKTSEIFSSGTLGSPMSASLKTATNGSFHFIFNGSYVEAVISSIPNLEEPAPDVICSVDGIMLPVDLPQVSENNWSLCSGNLSAGKHELTIDIQSQNTPLFFDYLLYSPSVPILPNEASLRIEASDPSIIYSGTFMTESDTGSARLTNSPGASINVSFTGQKLIWFGAYSSLLPTLPSAAEYSIDGAAFKQFSLPGLNNASSETQARLNQVLFRTGLLSQGSHQLTVRYLGNEQQTALSLAFLDIKSSTSTTSIRNVSTIANTSTTTSSQSLSSTSSIATSIASSTPLFSSTTTHTTSSVASTSPSGSSSSSSSSSSSAVHQTAHSSIAKPHSNRAILIGALVGAIVFILIIIAVLFYLRKRFKSRVLDERPQSKEPLDMPQTPDRLSTAFYDVAPSPSPSHPLQRGRTMRTMKTGTSDSLDGWIGPHGSKTPSVLSASQADSTEALIPQTPQIRSLFTSIFEDERRPVVIESDRRDSHIAYVELVPPSPIVSTYIRPLPTPPIGAQFQPRTQSVRSELEMLVAPPLAVPRGWI